MTLGVIRTVCPHDCPDQCSILATVEDGRLLKVAGDPANNFTGGFLCGKEKRLQRHFFCDMTLLQLSGVKL